MPPSWPCALNGVFCGHKSVASLEIVGKCKKGAEILFQSEENRISSYNMLSQQTHPVLLVHVDINQRKW